MVIHYCPIFTAIILRFSAFGRNSKFQLFSGLPVEILTKFVHFPALIALSRISQRELMHPASRLASRTGVQLCRSLAPKWLLSIESYLHPFWEYINVILAISFVICSIPHCITFAIPFRIVIPLIYRAHLWCSVRFAVVRKCFFAE